MQTKLSLNRISLITGALVVALAFFIAVYPHRSADWVFIPAFIVIAAYEFAKAAKSSRAGYFYVAQFGITVIGLVFVILAYSGLLAASVALVVVPAWSAANGAVRIAAGLYLRGRAHDWNWSAVLGALMVLAGAVMLILPGVGWLTMDTFIGIILGVIMFVAGIGSVADAFV